MTKIALLISALAVTAVVLAPTGTNATAPTAAVSAEVPAGSHSTAWD